MFTGLSLEQAPPYEAPLKFFLTAPIFAVLAGLTAAFSNSFELHDPKLIASIHLLTIGYMIMIIFGALQQMLPVVAGAVIPKAKLIANITYTLLIIGLIAFVFGFYLYEKILFFIASIITGACVSASGIVGFVGLIIPHFTRNITGPNHKVLIPAAAIGGAVFLSLSDSIARTIASPLEIPVGIITGLMGGGVLLVFLLKIKKLEF